jgi:hypothetical protein
MTTCSSPSSILLGPFASAGEMKVWRSCAEVSCDPNSWCVRGGVPCSWTRCSAVMGEITDVPALGFRHSCVARTYRVNGGRAVWAEAQVSATECYSGRC